MGYYFNPQDGKRYYVDDETGRMYDDSKLYGGQYTVEEVIKKKKELARRQAMRYGTTSTQRPNPSTGQPRRKRGIFGL